MVRSERHVQRNDVHTEVGMQHTTEEPAVDVAVRVQNARRQITRVPFQQVILKKKKGNNIRNKPRFFYRVCSLENPTYHVDCRTRRDVQTENN
jgi:hypothetical protein